MMTFPIYGKIRNVPNHQPDGNNVKNYHAKKNPIGFFVDLHNYGNIMIPWIYIYMDIYIYIMYALTNLKCLDMTCRTTKVGGFTLSPVQSLRCLSSVPESSTTLRRCWPLAVPISRCSVFATIKSDP